MFSLYNKRQRHFLTLGAPRTLNNVLATSVVYSNPIGYKGLQRKQAEWCKTYFFLELKTFQVFRFFVFRSVLYIDCACILFL